MFGQADKRCGLRQTSSRQFLWDLIKKPPKMFDDLVEHIIEELEVEDYMKDKT